MFNVSGFGAMAQTMMSQGMDPSRMEAMREQKQTILQDGISSGTIDPNEFQSKLVERFGSEAEGIVGKGGQIDFEKLDGLMQQQFQAMKDKMQGMQFGASTQSSEDSTIQTLLDALQSNDTEQESDWVGSLFELKA